MVDFYKNIVKYFDYIIYSTKAKLKSEVSKSYLNILWWVLNPLCYMLIYIFVVEIVFKAKEPNFPLFVFIGLTVWNFFNKMIITSTKIISNNKNIMSKVYIPKSILLVINSLILLFKMSISLIIVLVLMIFFKIPVTLSFFMFIPIILVLYVITFGISSILLHIGVYLDDLSNISELALKFLFYFSGIFYSIKTRIPDPFANLLLKFNPIAFLIDETRNVLLFQNFQDYFTLLIWLVVGLILSMIGIKLINRYENSYMKVLQ